jgi:hypothetical protein
MPFHSASPLLFLLSFHPLLFIKVKLFLVLNMDIPEKGRGKLGQKKAAAAAAAKKLTKETAKELLMANPNMFEPIAGGQFSKFFNINEGFLREGDD